MLRVHKLLLLLLWLLTVETRCCCSGSLWITSSTACLRPPAIVPLRSGAVVCGRGLIWVAVAKLLLSCTVERRKLSRSHHSWLLLLLLLLMGVMLLLLLLMVWAVGKTELKRSRSVIKGSAFQFIKTN